MRYFPLPISHSLHLILISLLLTSYVSADVPNTPFRITQPQTNGETYETTKAWFRQARKEKVGRAVLWSAIPDRLASHWYGTPWSFYGATETPNNGEIACGYFVTTVLRDAGFRLPRVKLAQLASETMIRRLVHKRHIRRFSNVPYAKFLIAMRKWGDGLYLVGLDNHTGFIQVRGMQVHFIHSSWVPFETTMKELAENAPVLAASRYRVVGKLSADKRLYRRWLKGQRVGYR